MGFRFQRLTRGGQIAALLSIVLLSAARLPAAHGDEASKAAKTAELVQLEGLGKMMEQSKLAGQEAATKLVRSITDKTYAQFPAFPEDKRIAMDRASQQFLHEVDSSFDQADAVQAWGRVYSDGLTEKELDAILAYYRSAVGQKDVRASQAALPKFQQYMDEQRTAAMESAVANYTAAIREILNPSNDSSIRPKTALTTRPADESPTAPDGKFVANSVSDRCEASPSIASRHDMPPSGRSIVCVCVDAKGTITQDPVIAESSGDSRVDSGAVKLARADSGRYKPPLVDGRPQKGCFRFAINFTHQE
jgi:hypothetical protein